MTLTLALYASYACELLTGIVANVCVCVCVPVSLQLCAGADRLNVDVYEARTRRRAAIRRNMAVQLKLATTDRELKLRRSQIGQFHYLLACALVQLYLSVP